MILLRFDHRFRLAMAFIKLQLVAGTRIAGVFVPGDVGGEAKQSQCQYEGKMGQFH